MSLERLLFGGERAADEYLFRCIFFGEDDNGVFGDCSKHISPKCMTKVHCDMDIKFSLN